MSLENFTHSVHKGCSTVLLVGTIAASPLLNGCDNRTSETRGNNIETVVERTNESGQMADVRAEIIDAFSRGESTTEPSPEPINYLYQHSNSGTNVGYGTLASIHLNQAGIEQTANMMKNNYVVVSPLGDISMMDPGELRQNLELIRSMFVRGGTIQMVGFIENPIVGKINPKILHPGNDMSSTYIEERLGRVDSIIKALEEWQESYIGKNIARLYSVDFATGQADEQVAWIIDLLDKNVSYGGERHQLRLKRVVETSDEDFPQYLVTEEYTSAPGVVIVDEHRNATTENFVLLPTTVGDNDNLNKYFHYFHAVIDASGQPLLRPGRINYPQKLQKFDEAIMISPINVKGEPQPFWD